MTPKHIEKKYEHLKQLKEKYLLKYEEKLKDLRDTCPHEYVQLSWYDSWNGYDYPAISTGTTVYECKYCFHRYEETKEIGHGII